MTFQDGLQTAVLIRWSPNGQRLGFGLECKLGGYVISDIVVFGQFRAQFIT